MAKRFTDSDKWKKQFLRGLQAPYKLLWIYILDECNHAGVWHVDFDVARIKIGEKLDQARAEIALASKIIIFDDGSKWFIPDFLEFQYGALNPNNKAHASVISILNKYGLLDEQFKPLASIIHDAMDMDMDKDKEQAVVIPIKNKPENPTEEEVIAYFIENHYKPEVAKKAFAYYAAGGWKDSGGKPVKAWKQKMQGVWFKPENKLPATISLFANQNDSW